VDEVNHVNMVVSFGCLFCDVLHVYCMFTSFFMMMMMRYNGLLVEDVNNHILQRSKFANPFLNVLRYAEVFYIVCMCFLLLSMFY